MDHAQLSVDSLLSLREMGGDGIIFIYHSNNDSDTQVTISDGMERSSLLVPDGKGRFVLRWDLLGLYAGGKVTANKVKGSMRLDFKLNDQKITNIVVNKAGLLQSFIIKPHFKSAIDKSDRIARALGVPIPDSIVIWLKSTNYREYSCVIGNKTFNSMDGIIYLLVSADDLNNEEGYLFSKTDITFE